MQPSLVDAALTPSSTTPSNNAANPSPITATKPSRLELIANRKLSRKEKDWTHAGPGPLSLVSSPNTVTQYLGLDGKKKRNTRDLRLRQAACAFVFCNPCGIQAAPLTPRQPCSTGPPQTSSEMYLDNGDHCQLDAFVIAKLPNQTTFIAQVREILQIKGSADDFSQRPSAVLLQSAVIGTVPDPSYGMPGISLLEQWSLVLMKVLRFTLRQ
jgi:hypothetical protein